MLEFVLKEIGPNGIFIEMMRSNISILSLLFSFPIFVFAQPSGNEKIFGHYDIVSHQGICYGSFLREGGTVSLEISPTDPPSYNSVRMKLLKRDGSAYEEFTIESGKTPCWTANTYNPNIRQYCQRKGKDWEFFIVSDFWLSGSSNLTFESYYRWKRPREVPSISEYECKVELRRRQF